ncbi:MAG TPA: HD domain-containing protein [Thermoplasmata archaeon]|nr:HD domain-containing protein [Thermoplasmata archaeon]
MTEKMLENGLLYGLNMPTSYTSLEEQSVKTIESGLSRFPKALSLFRMLQTDAEVTTLFNLANFIAVRKLGYNDHGPIHARICAANGIRLLDILVGDDSVELDSVKGLGLSEEDAYVIVMVACMLHDIGNAVHREEHEIFSVIYAKSLLDRLLTEIYPEISRRTEVLSQILHAVYAHDHGENALTIEAAIVVVADGADITKGRGRLSFDLGKHDIHSISALSIESVEIKKGETKPIEIHVTMSNSAGIYQLQETLGKKVAASPLRDYVEIVADLIPSRDVPEQRILDRMIFSDGKYKSS